MTVMTANIRTFAVHPIGSGFGWVVCEGPLSLVEAGLFIAVGKNPRLKCLRKFEQLRARIGPSELVLEAFDAPTTRRSQPAQALGLEFVAAATERGLTVEALSRASIQKAFDGVAAATREDIAHAVARHFPSLAPRLPKKRRPWDGEARRMAIFNAAAVALAHFHNGATALLNDMRNAA